jgi:hypothetical protein
MCRTLYPNDNLQVRSLVEFEVQLNEMGPATTLMLTFRPGDRTVTESGRGFERRTAPPCRISPCKQSSIFTVTWGSVFIEVKTAH